MNRAGPRAAVAHAGTASSPLQQFFSAVATAPWHYDFFSLLRHVEALNPKLPRIGAAMRPGQEVLRLGQDAGLDFAPAALARLELEGRSVPRLGVRFFGLLGPQGPMPLHFTEYVHEREHNAGDATPLHFLDIFHHRLLSLFYRAWAHTQPVVQRDRPADDRYGAWLGASFGLNDTTAGADRLPAAAKLHQAGLLGNRSRHAEGLVKLLSHFFGLPVALQGHVGHWLHLHDEDRSRLADAGSRGRHNARLGISATAGRKVWDRQSMFRLTLGPLTLRQYLAFLPGEPAWQQLNDAVDLYVGRRLLWDACLLLRADQVPPARLDGTIRLGLTSWLPGRGPAARARGDLHLRPGARVPRHTHGAPHG